MSTLLQNPPLLATPTDTSDQLRAQLERTQAAYISTLMEKNFLERAMADFNFHQNAHDGIVYLDAQGNVVYANPYFLKMMGINDPVDVLNKPLPSHMWFSPSDADQLISDVRQFGFVRERELNLYNKERAAVFVACSAVSSKDEDGNMAGVEIMLCNVTSKKKVQAELTERTRQLERLTHLVHSSIELLDEQVQRGVSRPELLKSIAEIKKHFDELL